MSNRRKLVIAGAAVAFAAAAGSGVAYAAGGDSAPAASTGGHPGASSSAPQGKTGDKAGKAGKHDKAKGKHDLARRAVHGQFTVKTKDGYKTILVQRGTVSAASSSSVTVSSADHYTHTYKIGSDTAVRIDKQKSSADKLTKGEKVVVTTGPKTGADTARIVVAHKG